MAAPEREVFDDEYSAPRGRRGLWARLALWGLAALAALALLWYAGGMLWVHRISDEPVVETGELAPGASRAVAVAAALIEREVDRNRWTANDPFFMPGAALDNMPNYQMGIVGALSRFTLELGDQIGRTRGSSQVDPDLDKAAGLLRYPGTVWIFDFSTSLAPTASSEQQYRAARRALLAYNERLAAKQAVFERRGDNLLGTLERIAADLGSLSAVIDHHLATRSGFGLDFQADDVFYATKGRLYAYLLLLRALGEDLEAVIRERELGAVWQQMLDSFGAAVALAPAVVVNGAPDGLLLPSHLATQGFYLLRARTQMREVINVLYK